MLVKIEFFKQNQYNTRAFSVIGVMAFSSLSLIMVLGLLKMLSNMNTDMADLQKSSSSRKALMYQLNAFMANGECTKILKNSLDSGTVQDLKKGGVGTSKEPIKFFVLKDKDNKTFIDVETQPTSNKKTLKQLYALEGHTVFQLSCKSSPDCNCTPPPPADSCDKKWAFSLFTQSYKNNLPVYKRVWSQELEISFNNNDFSCGVGVAEDTSQKDLKNIFYGFEAGKSNTTGEQNSFFGYQAGYSNNTGNDNSFFGYKAGYSNTEGNKNSFFGYQTGYSNTTGEQNSFFGFQAGYSNTTGSNNSFFGYKAGYSNTTGSNLLNIGNVIYGKTRGIDIGVSEPGHLKIYGKLEVCNTSCKEVDTDPVSSREHKKNMAPFQDYEGALEALLATPLFNYQFKDDYPEKTRMGVIAEELPESLQLPAEPDSPVQPDWPSIYGYLWAGLHALHKELVTVKEQTLQQKASIKSWLEKQLFFMQEKTTKEVQNLNTKIQELENRAEVLASNRDLKKQESLVSKSVQELQTEMAQIKKQEQQFQEELQKLQQQRQN